MAINGLHHVALSTHDIERLCGFYVDVMGFEVVSRGGWEGSPRHDLIVGLAGSATRTAMLRAGNLYLEIFQYSAPPPRDLGPSQPNDVGYTHMCLDVTDIVAEHARLSAGGMTFNGPPQFMREGAIATVYGRDPDGNIVEIQEVMGEAIPFKFRDLAVGASSI